MAASAGVHSYNSILAYGDTTSSFTNLSEVINYTPKRSVGVTKLTHLASDNAHHEYTPGLGEPGDITFSLNYTKATANTIIGFIRTRKYWKWTSSDGGNGIAYGFISEMGIPHPDDDRITIDVTVKFSGTWTYAVS